MDRFSDRGSTPLVSTITHTDELQEFIYGECATSIKANPNCFVKKELFGFVFHFNYPY